MLAQKQQHTEKTHQTTLVKTAWSYAAQHLTTSCYTTCANINTAKWSIPDTVCYTRFTTVASYPRGAGRLGIRFMDTRTSAQRNHRKHVMHKKPTVLSTAAAPTTANKHTNPWRMLQLLLCIAMMTAACGNENQAILQPLNEKIEAAKKDQQQILDLSSMNFGALHKNGLNDALETLATLKYTDVRTIAMGYNNFNNMDSHDLKKIFAALALTKVEAVWLDYNNLDFLTENDLVTVFSGFENTAVTSLNLSKNNLNNLEAKELANILAVFKNSHITALDLKGNHLPDTKIKDLQNASTQLKNLDGALIEINYQ